MSNVKAQIPNGIQIPKSIHRDIHDSKGRHSCECRDFKAAYNFTFRANIVKYTSEGIRHIRNNGSA